MFFRRVRAVFLICVAVCLSGCNVDNVDVNDTEQITISETTEVTTETKPPAESEIETVVINDNEIPINTKELHLYNNDLNNENVGELVKFKELKYLALENTYLTNFKPFSNLDKLETIWIYKTNTTEPIDLSPLSKCQSLKLLMLSHSDINLNTLTEVTQIEEINLKSLKHMNNLNFMTNMKNLKYVYINASDEIDISPLCELTKLKSIIMDFTVVKSIEPLRNLYELEEFHQGSWADVYDISVIRDLKNLKYLSLGNTNISRISELENLNGIMIATTNLSKNMDKAFARRFLYKIEFEKPDLETRKAIWESIITDLSFADIEVLAGKFDFSGGQIENIARRSAITTVLNGKPPSIEKLIDYCNEEKNEKAEKVKIGFRAS